MATWRGSDPGCALSLPSAQCQDPPSQMSPATCCLALHSRTSDLATLAHFNFLSSCQIWVSQPASELLFVPTPHRHSGCTAPPTCRLHLAQVFLLLLISSPHPRVVGGFSPQDYSPHPGFMGPAGDLAQSSAVLRTIEMQPPASEFY